MGARSLVVDVGGSSVKLGIVADGQLVSRATCAARPREGLAATLDEAGAELISLCRRASVDWRDCVGVGLGLPCIVNCHENRVIASPTNKYEDAPALDLHRWAADTFALPVRADNDAHLALLGEWQRGAGQGTDDLVMVTLGTGVGCSVLIGGHALRGPHYQAGLLGGFTVVKSGGRSCTESAAGCVEAETGTWALPAIAREYAEYSSSPVARLPEINYAHIFRLAEAGDPLARQLRDRSLGLWSDFLINLIHMFDPRRIVLGGAVLHRADDVIPWIQRRVDADAWMPSERVAICPAQYPDDAGLLGAHVMLTQPLKYL